MVDEYTGLREPACSISAGACGVHGITRKMVRGRRLDDDRVAVMLGKADFLIAHNATFDRGFVERLFPVCREMSWCCTMNGIDWRGRGFASRGLQHLLEAHGIVPDAKHRARADVGAVLELLMYKTDYLLELLNSVPGEEAAGRGTGERRRAEREAAAALSQSRAECGRGHR